jgi:hypothetical protein
MQIMIGGPFYTPTSEAVYLKLIQIVTQLTESSVPEWVLGDHLVPVEVVDAGSPEQVPNTLPGQGEELALHLLYGLQE